jgi:hypothetical protein
MSNKKSLINQIIASMSMRMSGDGDFLPKLGIGNWELGIGNWELGIVDK